MKRRTLAGLFALAFGVAVVHAQAPDRISDVGVPPATDSSTEQATDRPIAVATNIPYVDAKPILDVLREELLPAELMSRTPAEREGAWPAWVSRRNGETRARLQHADEDSTFNQLLLGTTFTTHPRVTDLASLREPGPSLDIVEGRLGDMIEAVGSSGADDERLRFARELFARRGIDPVTTEGKAQARQYLLAILARVIAETEGFARAAAAMSQLDSSMAKLALDATSYRDRGLSSDTSIIPSFGIDQALQRLAEEGRLGTGSVRRVAVVGPGLDVVDKREGHDFYPVQTIQPFAVVDSLFRLGLAVPDELRVTTLDINPRVNRHLEAAGQRARTGSAYVVQLPLGANERWHAELVSYWERFGGSIGDATQAAVPAQTDGAVRVRAIRVRPEVVRSVVPQDLNIVLQRLEPLAQEDGFDLIIATNVLVYYDVFEQSLAAANVAKMLRPGGVLLSNNFIIELPQSPIRLVSQTDVVYTESAIGDRLFGYALQNDTGAGSGR